MPTRFFAFLAAADRRCDALISTRPHDSNPDWGNSLLGVDVRFSNRPFGVKHPKSSAIHKNAGRLSHLWVSKRCVRLGAHTTVATGAMIAKVAAPIGRGLRAEPSCT